MTEPIKVTVLQASIWIENGLFGERAVMVQHEGCDPFEYAVFNYAYGYTDNASTLRAATNLALSLGATEPIEMRSRKLSIPTRGDIEAQIASLQECLSAMK